MGFDWSWLRSLVLLLPGEPLNTVYVLKMVMYNVNIVIDNIVDNRYNNNVLISSWNILDHVSLDSLVLLTRE